MYITLIDISADFTLQYTYVCVLLNTRSQFRRVSNNYSYMILIRK